METEPIQNDHGFLFSAGDRIRYAWDPCEHGTVVGLRHSDVWDDHVDWQVFIEWDDGLDHGWYPINEIEPIQAP